MSVEPPEESDECDRQDMARLCAGGDAALNELMERHAPRLFNYLLRSLGNEEDAADLAQETFVRVYQSRAKFDTNQRFTTWLYTIASNLVRSEYRHRSRHPTVSLDTESDSGSSGFREKVADEGQSPSEAVQAVERRETVRQAVGNLPEELRTALILSEYEDLSHADIGAVLGRSTKAVESRLYRARKQLREELKAMLR